MFAFVLKTELAKYWPPDVLLYFKLLHGTSHVFIFLNLLSSHAIS